ncbi:sodium:solute symporter [Luteimonas aestuarii]|uniref:Sodium:solute symporter n=1 Tax=Luteimonas aestuarii TaxID=453837 RepID=A0A4V3AM83_9GAMM|nr:sodium:solute symporter [Luteimonas aestuarii]TDK23078.1 sodium:solute symporter [Luteimonas aestuarii]
MSLRGGRVGLRRAGVRWLALGWLLLAVSLPAWAEGLVSVHEQALPALPAGADPLRLQVVAERVVVRGSGGAWVLDAAGTAWRDATMPDDTGLQAVASTDSGAQAWQLWSDDAGLQRIDALAWQGDVLQATPMGVPPVALHDARAAVLSGALFVAGLDAAGRTQLWSWPLGSARATWTAHGGWPGDEAPAVLVAQKFALYVATQGGGLWQWNATDGWQSQGPLPAALATDAARAIGQAHVLFLLQGANGREPRLFHTITGSWAPLPATLPSDAGALVPRGNGWLWSGGDGGVHEARIESGKHLLAWLDWLVIVVYLAGVMGIGVYFYRKDQTASGADFFVGGRSIPFWVAGVSLYATNTSSISFIAIPAKAYESNWQYMTNNLVAVLGLMFVAVWIVPLLRRLDLMSVFSYLETRFHPAIRMLASALAIAMQVGSRLSVILFLPALAIATITGIDVVWSILIMGGFTIAYTAMGGMRAVVWTDFVQVFVKMGGALFAIGFILWSLGGDFDSVREAVVDQRKTQLLDFSFDLTKATVWGFIFLVVFDVVLTFPKDQVLMQRTLSTRSDKEAGRSIWIFAAMMIPGGFIFYGIGTALWMYYRNNPERLDPLLPIDATFPLFIAAELPMGVTGLIIAGIFAAAMSTLSSIINSVATLLSVDFYGKLARNPTDKGGVRFAEWMTVLVGLVGIGLALLLSRYDIHSLFDVSIELAGLLGGGFAGAYTLGMFTRRANSAGVAIGVAGAIALTLLAWSFDLVHPYFYLGISIMLCIVIGYLASLCFPPPDRSLEGLTIHDRVKARA